jgi:hypothetical protein
VEIDQNAMLISNRFSSARRIHIDVHTADLSVLAIDGKQRLIPSQKRLHEAWNTSILLHHLRILHLLQVLRHIRARLRAQIRRKRDSFCWNHDRSIGLYLNFCRCTLCRDARRCQ